MMRSLVKFHYGIDECKNCDKGEWVEQDHHPFEDETAHGKVVWNR